jgi:hypothetical protein
MTRFSLKRNSPGLQSVTILTFITPVVIFSNHIHGIHICIRPFLSGHILLIVSHVNKGEMSYLNAIHTFITCVVW